MSDLASFSDIELQARAARILAAMKDAERILHLQEAVAITARRRAYEAMEALDEIDRQLTRFQTEYRAIQAENGKRGAFVVIGQLPVIEGNSNVV